MLSCIPNGVQPPSSLPNTPSQKTRQRNRRFGKEIWSATINRNHGCDVCQMRGWMRKTRTVGNPNCLQTSNWSCSNSRCLKSIERFPVSSARSVRSWFSIRVYTKIPLTAHIHIGKDKKNGPGLTIHISDIASCSRIQITRAPSATCSRSSSRFGGFVNECDGSLKWAGFDKLVHLSCAFIWNFWAGVPWGVRIVVT